jgi:hypothetical protein
MKNGVNTNAVKVYAYYSKMQHFAGLKFKLAMTL